MEEKQQLEEQMRAVMDKYKYKRRQIRELQEDLQTMSNTLDNLRRDEDAYADMVDEKKVNIDSFVQQVSLLRPLVYKTGSIINTSYFWSQPANLIDFWSSS